MTEKRGRGIAIASLAIVLLVGGWLRLSGIAYDQPYVYHPDEWAIARRAVVMVQNGDPDPHNYWYPSALTDAEALIVSGIHTATGTSTVTPTYTGVGGLDAMAQSDLPPDQFSFVLWGRLLVALMGFLTILAVALAGLAGARSDRRRLAAAPQSGDIDSGGRQDALRAWVAALAGAAFIALAVLPIDDSRFLTTDGPSAFFTALTLAATFAAMARPAGKVGDRLLILAGLCAGLAAGMKYNGGLVIMVPALAYLARAGSFRSVPALLRSAIRSRTPYLVVLAAVAGFVISTPAVLVHPILVLKAMRSVEYHYAVRGYAGYNGDSARFYINFLWQSGFGPVLSILAVAGIAWAVVRHRATDLILLAFTAAYWAMASAPLARFERNLLPLVPFVAVLAGRFVADLTVAAHDLVGRRSPRLAMAAVPVLLLALVIQPAAAGIGDAQSHNLPDTRTQAAVWADANLPAGATIVRENYTPQVDPTRFHTGFINALGTRDVAWYRAQGFRYIVSSDWMRAQYVQEGGTESSYDAILALPVVYRLDPGPGLGGPSIEILDLGA